MKNNNDFDEALKFTLKWEGFISDEKDDPGKLTIWGISSKYNPQEVAEMKRLIDEGKKEEAFEICEKTYKDKYWDRAKCYNYPQEVAIVMFEIAVNPGIGALGIALKENPSDWKDLLLKRIKYFSDKNNKAKIRGWVRRCVDLYDYIEGKQ